jgi:hypothetical protein
MAAETDSEIASPQCAIPYDSRNENLNIIIPTNIKRKTYKNHVKKYSEKIHDICYGLFKIIFNMKNIIYFMLTIVMILFYESYVFIYIYLIDIIIIFLLCYIIGIRIYLYNNKYLKYLYVICVLFHMLLIIWIYFNETLKQYPFFHMAILYNHICDIIIFILCTIVLIIKMCKK